MADFETEQNAITCHTVYYQSFTKYINELNKEMSFVPKNKYRSRDTQAKENRFYFHTRYIRYKNH